MQAARGPWWEGPLHQQMWAQSHAVTLSLDLLILRALEHSAQIRVFSDMPLIRKTTVVEADAAFDWHAFMETRWDDISDPVGNTLTVGPGATRYHDHLWNYKGGVRQKNRLGGQFEASQRIGHENSNSTFFVPQDQGTARLALSYTQPLLRGAGKVYNTSLVVLAEMDTEIAHDELLWRLQSHLLDIGRAYWALYLERGALLQKGRLYDRAKQILNELEGRAGLDTAASQVVRVRAAVAEREADLLRAEAAVRNAEERIRALVNDPELAAIQQPEFVPLDTPACAQIPLDMSQALAVAYHQRPEIDQALRQVKAASVRMDMSKNELLPQLDVVLEAYASGLRGESQIEKALNDQFSVGEPSYSLGLMYELPFRNRAAKARHERRQLELRQLQSQFRATVETLMLEVRVAVREVDTTYREILAKGRAMQAAEERLDYIHERWQHLAGVERSADLHLEDLLLAQQQLAAAEFQHLQAATTYSVSLMNLKRATGSLLQDERISHTVVQMDTLPAAILAKEQVAPQWHVPPQPSPPQRTNQQQIVRGMPPAPARVVWEPDPHSKPASDGKPTENEQHVSRRSLEQAPTEAQFAQPKQEHATPNHDRGSQFIPASAPRAAGTPPFSPNPTGVPPHGSGQWPNLAK